MTTDLPPAQAVEVPRTSSTKKMNVVVQEATDDDLADIIRIFWSSFSIIFPFHEVEPESIRAPEEIRLRRAVHRQKVVLENKDSLMLIAKDRDTGEVVGYAGYLRPSGCFKPHPWIAEDASLITKEDEEAWEGVDRKHWNSLWRGWDDYRFKIMKGRDHWLLAPLCVKPSAQGQGVGSALLEYVNNLVDSSDHPVPIYLDASKAGQPVYLKAGYEYFGEKGREFPGMVRWSGTQPIELK